MECIVDGCTNPKKNSKLGYCDTHRKRFARYGDPLKILKPRHPKKTTSKEYSSYWNMKQRCLNPNNKQYDDYGGRGIKICDRWLGAYGFNNFYEDMGDKPSPDLSLERIDNNQGYNPDNCKWATRTEQNRNQRLRKKNYSGYRGVYKNSNLWTTEVRINGVRKNLGYFKSLPEAVEARKEAEKLYWD